jgi:hypothetical protein
MAALDDAGLDTITTSAGTSSSIRATPTIRLTRADALVYLAAGASQISPTQMRHGVLAMQQPDVHALRRDLRPTDALDA